MGSLEGQRGGNSLLGGGKTSTEVVSLLKENADSYTWVAATIGSQSAAEPRAANAAVMSIGGYNGTDPSPTLEQFKKLVEQGTIHYYIAGGGIKGKQMGGSQVASEIEQWVEENFTAQTVNGVTLYDLTQTHTNN